jgi:imidazolonepropionase-like amidohydrolase
MRIPFLAAFASAALFAGQEDTFLLRNVTVHTIKNGNIANGAIYVRDGKIAGVGANLKAPNGVRVIDGKQAHVYPGIIDSGAELGLQEIGSVRETADTTELGDFNPQLRTAVAINPSSEHIPVARANGITSYMALPLGGIIAGQASLMNLDGWTWEEMEIKRSGAMHIRFPVLPSAGEGRGGGGRFGMTRLSYPEAKRQYDMQVEKLQEFFEQSRRYQRAKTAKQPDFRVDLKYEAMIPVLEGKLPVMVTAVHERTILDAIKFADQEKIKIVLAGVREPGKAVADIKSRNIPVILGPTLELPLNEDDPYDAPFALAGELHKSGIKIAFASFSSSFTRNLPYQVANAVAFGLPYEEGLKSITLNAAEIWGVSDRIGSIEEGKVADLMVVDGDPLETKTQVKQVFIKGKPVDLSNKHKTLYEKYSARP